MSSLGGPPLELVFYGVLDSCSMGFYISFCYIFLVFGYLHGR